MVVGFTAPPPETPDWTLGAVVDEDVLAGAVPLLPPVPVMVLAVWTADEIVELDPEATACEIAGPWP